MFISKAYLFEVRYVVFAYFVNFLLVINYDFRLVQFLLLEGRADLVVNMDMFLSSWLKYLIVIASLFLFCYIRFGPFMQLNDGIWFVVDIGFFYER